MQSDKKKGCFTLALNTVDGQNPARTPVEVGSLPHDFYKVLYVPGGVLPGFLNHQH